MEKFSNAGWWRDSLLRKNLNVESTDAIWNAIQSTDLKNNITPVLKITNNNANNKNFRDNSSSDNTSNASSTTIDKLWILSPSEMGMPIMKNYNVMAPYGGGGGDGDESDANVHYYGSNFYKNTIKSSRDGNGNKYGWLGVYSDLYTGDAYQWWMLPAGARKMSNGNQAYHNTD